MSRQRHGQRCEGRPEKKFTGRIALMRPLKFSLKDRQHGFGFESTFVIIFVTLFRGNTFFAKITNFAP